ncbi:MAG: hypothetical protein FK734_13150 [Asgard group archaeon]|nr:hypothetical protein [Asgard group archaeon]
MLKNPERDKFLQLLLLIIIIIETVAVESTVNEKSIINSSANAEDKIYNGFIFDFGEFTNYDHTDSYLIKLKATKTYVLRMTVHFELGFFSLRIGNSLNDNETISSNLNDTMPSLNDKYTIEFFFIPEFDDIYTIKAENATYETGTYSLFVHRKGIAGWWWLILAILVMTLLYPIMSYSIKFIVGKMKTKRNQIKKLNQD